MSAQLAAWRKICHHLDGVAIGSTVCTLLQRGFFEALETARAPLPVDELAARLGARRGYLHLAVKLLTAQGWLERSGDIQGGNTCAALTDAGRRWLDQVEAYRHVPRLLERAAQMIADPERGPDDAEILGAATAQLDARVRLHLQGHLVAAAMKGIGMATMRHDEETFERELQRALPLFATQGWADAHGILSPEGHVAVQAAPQFFVPVSYLPTMAAVPDLLFGERPFVDSGEIEQHVDRALDVAASGLVFQRVCKEPFLQLALPLFDAQPLSGQPAAVVDTGSGDGTLLIELFAAVAQRTARGRQLESHPLLMVGAEYTPVVRDISERRLRDAGVPHLTIPGDIGDPDGIAAALAARGIDPHDVLHVSKSVIHNRCYTAPQGKAAFRPASQAVFVDRDGELVVAADLEQNLVEHFERWLPWTRRHGMIAIESHTVAPALVARSIGNNVVTELEATHGYSLQYLVEIEVHRRAARLAGYLPRTSTDLAGETTGRPLMSIDHLVAEESVPWLDRLLS